MFGKPWSSQSASSARAARPTHALLASLGYEDTAGANAGEADLVKSATSSRYAGLSIRYGTMT